MSRVTLKRTEREVAALMGGLRLPVRCSTQGATSPSRPTMSQCGVEWKHGGAHDAADT